MKDFLLKKKLNYIYCFQFVANECEYVTKDIRLASDQ